MALLQKSGPIVSNNLHGLNPSISSHSIHVQEAIGLNPSIFSHSIHVKEAIPKGNSAFGSNPLIKSKPSRSWDPRLANTNSEVSISIDTEEAVHDGHSLKRHRGLSYGGQVMPSRGGWLEENTLGNLLSSKKQRVEISDSMKERLVKQENAVVLGSDMKLDGNINANISIVVRSGKAIVVRSGKGPGSSNMGVAMLPNLGNIASLPNLIKYIVTNPNMILQLIQKQQQRLGALQKPINTLPQNLSSLSSTCTVMSLSTGAPLSMSSMKEDVGKPRMKPRDPRRILHTNLIPTYVSSKRQPKPNGTDPSTIHSSTITPSSREFNMLVNPSSSLPINLERKGNKDRGSEQMFFAHKISLVLDLDHTLLNFAKFIEVDRVHNEILKKEEEQNRLKPRVTFELHICTMGNKVCAIEMAKVLDPTRSLFAGCVISKGDNGDPFDRDERLPKRKDLDGVLGMEYAVVMIDDSTKVLPHHKHNLIVIGLHWPSLLEINHDESPDDGTLASSLAVIEKIHHHSFFSNRSPNEVDVRDIIASNQQIYKKCAKWCSVGSLILWLFLLALIRLTGLCLMVNVIHPGWLEASVLLYR
ncbi:hypothetical protein AMTRI_Chr12g241210 [Amborella trichopoda]